MNLTDREVIKLMTLQTEIDSETSGKCRGYTSVTGHVRSDLFLTTQEDERRSWKLKPRGKAFSSLSLGNNYGKEKSKVRKQESQGKR